MTTNTAPASNVIGYARVSTVDQTLDQQTAALTAAGAGKIFHDVMSGARDDRPGLAECLRYLREGDTLVITKLDRLGRNMRSMVNRLGELSDRGIVVRSLHDGVDTSTASGRMFAGLLSVMAQYELDAIRERTQLKLDYLRKSGRKFGRPRKLSAEQAAAARRMRANGDTATAIARILGISRTQLYTYLAEQDDAVA